MQKWLLQTLVCVLMVSASLQVIAYDCRAVCQGEDPVNADVVSGPALQLEERFATIL